MASSARNQFLAATFANILTVSYGAFVGWTSASFLELQSPESPLDSGPLSNEDAGWIVSLLCVGGALGAMFFSWCADKIGRKRCLLLLALPGLIGWWIIPFARIPLHLSLSRFVGGICGGGTFAVVPIYTAELSEARVRGVLGTFLVLTCNFGVLLAFVLGNFYTFSVVAWILSLLPLSFLLCFVFVPETPQFLASQNKMKEAEKSLCFFRNISDNLSDASSAVKSELKCLMEPKATSVPNSNKDKITCKDFFEEKARKALAIGVGLMALNQCCGCFALLNYTATIFKQSGSDLPPNISAIAVAIIQLLGSYVSTLLVERAGRKILLIISAIGTGIGLVCLGSFILLGGKGLLAWASVASFSFTIFIGCLGVITLPVVVIAEVLPPRLRSQGCMVCMLIMWIFSFFMVKYMAVFAELLGLHGVMFFFASCCFIGTVFIVFAVPETKGRTSEDILQQL